MLEAFINGLYDDNRNADTPGPVIFARFLSLFLLFVAYFLVMIM